MTSLAALRALALTAGLVALGSGAASAQAAFKDAICPEATASVVELGRLTANDAPRRIYEAAKAAVSAYDGCANRHLADADFEPGFHYAFTRGAGFAILEARALVALDRPAEAKAVVLTARRQAQDVVDWRRSIGQSGSNIASSGSDNRPSVYRQAAKDIVTAADSMLINLAAAPTPEPSASPR